MIQEASGIFGTVISFVAINSIVIGALIILLKGYLLSSYIESVPFYPYFLLSILIAIVNPIYTIYQTILRTKQEAKEHAINSSLNFLLLIFFNVIFIAILKIGAVGQLLSYLITGFLFSVWSIYRLLRRKVIKIVIRKNHLFDALKYSIPLIPHSMSETIALFISRIFLNNVSTADLGLFSVASQFLIIISTIQTSVNSSYVPWSFDLMKKGKEYYHELVNFADFFLRVNCIISLALSLFIKEIVALMTQPEYYSSWVVVPILVIAYQIKGMYYFYINTLFYNKKATKLIFLTTLIGNTINIIVSATLTKVLGIYTPGIALLCGITVTTIIAIIISVGYEDIRFKLGRMIIYLLILIFVRIRFVIDSKEQTNINVVNILIKAAMFIITFLLLLKKIYQR